MASTKDAKRTEGGRVTYRGESFSGFNKPKRTSGGKKKFAVLARQGDQIKLVRFRRSQHDNQKKHTRKKSQFSRSP